MSSPNGAQNPMSNFERNIAAKILDDVADLSRDVEGISRPAYSPKETEILHYLEHLAKHQGLSVSYDGGQNALFSLPEDEEATKFRLVGSHVDSVPRGGNYDGLAGVVAGLLCLIRAKNEGRSFTKPVKVIAMRGEESAWFGPCYIASRALLGLLTDVERNALHKGDGQTLESHMKAVGIDIGPVRNQQPLVDKDCFLEFIELHIEQGPLLVEKKIPAAIVSGIRGNFRHRQIRCIGEEGHSGAVPRAYRRDPVLAMADLFTRLDANWLTILQKGDDLVLTSGIVSTDTAKNAMTRIPDEVSFSLDIRSQSDEVLENMRDLLAFEMKQVEDERGVKFLLDQEIAVDPAAMDETLVDNLASAMGRVGVEPFIMASGGGHDAAMFANVGVPSAMVFVRNQHGSHNPYEAMEIDDLMVGTSIIYDHLTNA